MWIFEIKPKLEAVLSYPDFTKITGKVRSQISRFHVGIRIWVTITFREYETGMGRDPISPPTTFDKFGDPFFGKALILSGYSNLMVMAETLEHIKTLIIGSGPAGYTAAIYAARADLKPVLYTGMEPGGQLTTTTEVDNFPGYPQGIDGPSMMVQLQQQAERFGTEVRIGMITEVKLSDRVGGIHKVTTDSGQILEAETVIISTGATAKYLNLPSEQRLRGGGVSACAVCDGFFYKGKDVAIVGGGDTAAEEASYLANICKKVTMLVRKDHMRASKAMQHRVNSLPNLEIRYNSEVHEVIGDQVVEGIVAFNNETGIREIIPVEGLFIAIGHKPNTEIFKGQVDMDEIGYIKTLGKSTKTNRPGVFACGDAQDKEYRQAITAAGTGCMAALDAERYLATVEAPQEAV